MSKKNSISRNSQCTDPKAEYPDMSKEQQGGQGGWSEGEKEYKNRRQCNMGQNPLGLLSYCEIYFSHNEWRAVMKIVPSLSSCSLTVTSWFSFNVILNLMITDICYCLQKVYHFIPT